MIDYEFIPRKEIPEVRRGDRQEYVPVVRELIERGDASALKIKVKDRKFRETSDALRWAARKLGVDVTVRYARGESAIYIALRKAEVKQ